MNRGRTLYTWFVRIVWLPLLGVALFLCWLIWSEWAEESAIRAASVPADARILSIRDEASSVIPGRRGGSTQTKYAVSVEIVSELARDVAEALQPGAVAARRAARAAKAGP